jgi:hypothetical protein
MGGYTHGRGLKSQLADGVGLICRFSIASNVLEGNSSEVLPEIES